MHEAAEEYTHGNHSFLFLDICPCGLHEWKKADFCGECTYWILYLSISSSLFVTNPIYCFAVTLCISLSHFSNLVSGKRDQHLFLACVDSTLVPAMHGFAFVRLAYSGNKFFRGGPENSFRGELILEGSKLNMHNALHITSLHKSTGINNFSIKQDLHLKEK